MPHVFIKTAAEMLEQHERVEFDGLVQIQLSPGVQRVGGIGKNRWPTQDKIHLA